MTPRRILALSPHTDDAEFGAGASIARWVREGHSVEIHAFSDCGLKKLSAEFLRAQKAMGLPCDGRVGKLKVRHFPEVRQYILDWMISQRGAGHFDLVLCPSRADTHQDHQVIAAEAVRAFKGTTTLGYVLPWNTPTVSVSTWVPVTRADVERKIAALKCYKSQAHRPYATEDAVWAHARLGGLQAGCEFAEPFETIRSVI